MAEIDKKPEIRFTGFTDAWEQRKLGDILKTHQFSPYLAEPSDYGNYEVIQQGDKSVVGYANGIPFENYPDVVLFGDHTLSLYKPREPFFVATDGVKILSADGLEGNFLFTLLERYKPESQGYKRHFTILKNERGWITENKEEQAKIGSFFKGLDHLITLHQRKYDKLVIVKKSLLEKMFPKDGANVPEIRFAGFTDDWEQFMVSDVLTEQSRPIEMDDKETYQLITVKRRNGGIVSRGFYKGKDILVKNYYEVHEGDYVISKRQIIHGANGIVPKSLDKSIVSNEYLVCSGNEHITSEFWGLMSKLPEMYRLFFLSSYGVDIEKMVFDVEDWKKRMITIPSIPEQNKITEYFATLDNLISLHQHNLEKLKNIKKSMLEKIFV
ncbi:restriction endonuclease subunit S [Brevibacillus laterosporus]|uniref:Type I restriction modification DNA specificity domain protein n=1 Tax=Brevibacillus laterosporus LMG 15441 TaxID=1042163 RepID=A0A075RAJ4_BRELA|nr:restriction endonuclease subunit S [Brevibacillus laterosporus]AIG28416.1 type I restriction modification DNA specificity domain protein [Brevibacillus laterosporus LMG 15441]RJL13490.1 restriction endonuclease subunit S [Brevibacillus laterosporus]TPH16875.1 restriction endonuclease subunit S [Brevibacillus laterosporus]HAS01511.1 restriction endonuclease subunit S [Brevibacillus sp.]